jgi:DNA-binding MarR family transcriptional regulator
MTEKRLNMSLDMMRTMAGLSHILSWGEFQVYTMLLYERDPLTSRIRMNQTEIGKTIGYDTSMIKGFVAKLRDLSLIRKWRSQAGNYYELVFPLPETLVGKVRESIPAFGRELELSTKRKKKKVLADKSSDSKSVSTALEQDAPPEDNPITDEKSGNPREICDAPEHGLSRGITSEPIGKGSYSGEAAFDPQISRLLDQLERGTVRNTVCRFLEYLGFLAPQLALDQEITVDRSGLLAYLIERDANTITTFCELVEDFRKSAPKSAPYIDVPLTYPITLRIHHKLDLFPCGSQWLRQVIRVRNDDGILLSDQEVRQNLYVFMLEHGLKTFDEVITMAKSKHYEIVDARKTKRVLSPEEFGLGQYVQ